MYPNKEEVGITLEDKQSQVAAPRPRPQAPPPRPRPPGPALTEAAVDDSEAAAQSTD